LVIFQESKPRIQKAQRVSCQDQRSSQTRGFSRVERSRTQARQSKPWVTDELLGVSTNRQTALDGCKSHRSAVPGKHQNTTAVTQDSKNLLFFKNDAHKYPEMVPSQQACSYSTTVVATEGNHNFTAPPPGDGSVIKSHREGEGERALDLSCSGTDQELNSQQTVQCRSCSIHRTDCDSLEE